MAEKAKKEAVYADLHEIPENMIGEIIAGDRNPPCLSLVVTREKMKNESKKETQFTRNFRAWAEITGLCLSLKESYLQGQSPVANPKKQLFFELRKIKENKWITPLS